MSYLNRCIYRRKGFELRQDSRQQAAEGFFKQEYPALYRYALYLVKDEGAAQDLCQETFLRWFTLPHVRDITMPRAWLKKVLSRLAFNYFRHQKQIAKWQISNPDCLINASVDMKRDLNRIEVEDVLSSLPWKDQLLIKMRMAGLSYAEMAEVMQVSIGSVGTMLMRAMRKFKAAYEGKEVEINYEMSGSKSSVAICGEGTVN